MNSPLLASRRDRGCGERIWSWVGWSSSSSSSPNQEPSTAETVQLLMTVSADLTMAMQSADGRIEDKRNEALRYRKAGRSQQAAIAWAAAKELDRQHAQWYAMKTTVDSVANEITSQQQNAAMFSAFSSANKALERIGEIAAPRDVNKLLESLHTQFQSGANITEMFSDTSKVKNEALVDPDDLEREMEAFLATDHRHRPQQRGDNNSNSIDKQTQMDTNKEIVLDDDDDCLVLDEAMAYLTSCVLPVIEESDLKDAPVTEVLKRTREEAVHAGAEEEKDADASVQTDSGDKTGARRKARSVRSQEDDGDDGEASSAKVSAQIFFSSSFSTFRLLLVKKSSSKKDVLLARFGQGDDLKRAKRENGHRKMTSSLYFDHDIVNIPVVVMDKNGNETLRAPGVGYRFHPVKDPNHKVADARTRKARVNSFMRAHTDDEGNLSLHGKPTDYINRNIANKANPCPSKGQGDPYELLISDSEGADVMIPPQVVLHQVQKLTRMMDTIMNRVVPELDKLRLASDPSKRSLYEELCMDLHRDDLRHAQIPFLRKHDPENPTPQDVSEDAWNQCYYVTELEKKIAADAETERKAKMDAIVTDIEMTRNLSSAAYSVGIDKFLCDVDFNDLGKLSEAAMPNELMSFPAL